jgi:hypothetical protein
VIILATVIGLSLPLVTAATSGAPRPALSLVMRGGAVGLALSSALISVCSLLHFTDLRWLAANQRGSVHVRLIVVTWRRARRAEIRQVVREEIQRTTVGAAR